MKKLLIPFLLILVVLFGLVLWWTSAIMAPKGGGGEKRFVITKGASADGIGNSLKSEGLIKDSLAFKIYTQMAGMSQKIQAGEYSLPSNLTLPKLVALLLKGPTQVWVTIPEGLRREEIAEKFEDRGNFRQEFLELTRDKEGFLFPDTYLFPKDVKASLVVTTLTNTFDKKFKKEIGENYKSDPSGAEASLTLQQIVNLAAILERETLTEAEKPIVAGILLKRLGAGWPLQADATVQYAVASAKCKVHSAQCKWWEPVTKADLAIKSLYNTYLHRGLPPSPIANPGIGSIKAVVNPVASDYWFYLHDSKGQIHYASTTQEHNENVRKFL